MSEIKDYRQSSRENWGISGEVNQETLKVGALLRIADALEVVSKNYNALITDRDFYKRRYLEQSEVNDKNRRIIAGLRGHIKRKKKA